MLKNKNLIIFIVQLILSSIALFIITKFHDEGNKLVENIVFFTFYILLGHTVFKNAFLDFVRGKFMRESFLMTIATLGAIAIHEYPEALAVLIFYRIGMYFEDKATSKSRNTILSLMSVRADTANLFVGGEIKTVDVKDVKVGDTISIYPFEKIPLDSVIIEGETWLDTKALTGESMPKTVGKDDNILAGMINGESSIKAQVLKVYDESSIARILKLVEESQTRKAKIEKFISRFASIYTPIVVALALALIIIPPFIFGGGIFTEWFRRALTLLVISCPCAFVVGIPLTYFAAIGRASKIGVIVKGGVFFDLLSKVNAVIFDKTGTLTKGEFSVKSIINNSGLDEKTFVKYTSYAESQSKHPIAKSIVHYYETEYEKINSSLVDNYKDISGRGVITTIDNKNVLVGGASLMRENNIELPLDVNKDINVYVAIDDTYAGGFIIDDSVKEDTHEAIVKLSKMGIKTAILSGDKKERVEIFAKENNIDYAIGACLPEDKVVRLEELMKNAKASIFVGDGINDAPSLARADVGIAMGALGSDAAVENADVVIMDDKPSKVAAIIKLAKRTNIIVWQNIMLAFVIKFVVIILGFFGLATMWMAILADTGVTVLVIFNALRILYPMFEKRDDKHLDALHSKEISGACNCDH